MTNKSKEYMENIEEFVSTAIIGLIASGVLGLVLGTKTGAVLIIIGLIVLAIGSLTVFLPRVYDEDYKYLHD